MISFKIDFSVSFQLFNPFEFFWLIIIESAQSESSSYKIMLKFTFAFLVTHVGSWPLRLWAYRLKG